VTVSSIALVAVAASVGIDDDFSRESVLFLITVSILSVTDSEIFSISFFVSSIVSFFMEAASSVACSISSLTLGLDQVYKSSLTFNIIYTV